MTLHAFTSITANYLPKAAVLAQSLRRHHPEVPFHVVLSDDWPADAPAGLRDLFASVIPIAALPLGDALPRWAFRHRLVELCTAVKGPALAHLGAALGARRVVYFDPDIAVFSRLDDLFGRLDGAGVLLTPHQTEPEPADAVRAIVENELTSLRHGVYNLGFVAVNLERPDGARFASWWADRLRRFCYADIPAGLFTDQRWVDLAPAFFDDLAIVRDPRFNVATWNLSHRRATGTAPDAVRVEGRPLGFYHFSGLDAGAQREMLARYGSHSPVLFALRAWYLEQCEAMGQARLGGRPSTFAAYGDGTPVPDAHRLLYRARLDLMERFPDPYACGDPSRSFAHWCRTAGAAQVQGARPEVAPSRPSLGRFLRRHAPGPALRLARGARAALRRLAGRP